MSYLVNEISCRNLAISTLREWLLTNQLGGYAMGTVSGINTRRYHGLLVAATIPPATRMVLLEAMDVFVQTTSNPVGISSNQYPGAIYPQGYLNLTGFSAGKQISWCYEIGKDVVEATLQMQERKNAVTIRYQNKGPNPIQLTLRPLVCHKFYHSNFHESPDYPQALSFSKNSTVITNAGISLYLDHPGAKRTPVQGWYYRFEHQREVERGLDPRDDLFCPCELLYELKPGETAVLVAADEKGIKALPPLLPEPRERHDLEERLTQAAELFFVKTKNRSSIIAGYPWFTDWGRDTMISLPGALLHTGHIADARNILSDFSHQMFQGLIPNRFVESGEQPAYNTVDATLWFVNCIYRTLEMEWHRDFATKMMACMRDIFEWHTKGTLYGIKVDPEDGLLTQGEGTDLQLTWMDAKIGDWVVTPRHGKPVEINGLWVNAMRCMEWLADKLGQDSKQFKQAAEKAEKSFTEKFWYEAHGHYYDTIDPVDASLRPNQVIAMALKFSPATGPHAIKALKVVAKELLTPVGLRTLGPNEPGYKGQYKGTLPELDAAYHQGTVWPWLLGQYVSALVKLTGRSGTIDSDLKVRREAKRLLGEAKEMLIYYGVGGIAEVYDGDAPHQPNGCPFQAWSASEILRSWKEDCT